MIPLACYKCSDPRLKSDIPELYYWVYLLPLALVLYWFVYYREDKLSARPVVGSLLAAGVVKFAFGSMGLFKIGIFPILLAVFGYCFYVIARSETLEKGLALGLLSLFLLTSVWARVQQYRHGSYWELYRPQTEGSFTWINNAAKEDRFTKEQLLRHLKSDNPVVRGNIRKIVVFTGPEEKRRDEVQEFYESLKAIEPDIAESYLKGVPHAIQGDIIRGF